jgi:hypothetical protein
MFLCEHRITYAKSRTDGSHRSSHGHQASGRSSWYDAYPKAGDAMSSAIREEAEIVFCKCLF